MNNQRQKQMQQAIETFAREVATIIAASVSDAVAEGVRMSPAAARVGGRPKHGRGSSLDTETVLRELKRKGNVGVEHLAKALGTSTRSLFLPLRKLRASRKVKTTGQRRGMKYSAR